MLVFYLNHTNIATSFLAGIELHLLFVKFALFMFRRIVILSFVCLLAVACGSKKKVSVAGPQTRNFPSVSVPKVITDQQEGLEYVSAHFWDDFADTSRKWMEDSTHIAGVDKTLLEEQIGMYTSLLSMIPLETARQDVEEFCSQVEKFERQDTASRAFEESVALVKRYLYDPNSPVRNEDIYGALAARLASSEYVPESLKPSYQYDAQLCALNMAGTPASDFGFMDKDGHRGTLYGIKAPYTLLFFVNPGCPACAEIIQSIKSSEKIEDLVKGKVLAVLDMYIDDDIEAWREHCGDYPPQWITAYDKALTIRNELIYNVRAIPSLYVLDKDKKVIMKDAPEDKVLSFLESIEE